MSLEIELFVLCEGATADSRGALALVGLGQNVLTPPKLPATGSRTLALLIHEDEAGSGSLSPGTNVDVEVRVEGPDEAPAGSLLETLVAGDSRYSEVPSGVGMVTELKIKFTKPGRYRAHLTLSTTEEELKAATDLFVLAGSAAGD